MGLYISIVWVAARVVRVTFIDLVSNKIMFYELPNVDLVLSLCLDIYLVREMKDYLLEEELFAKLIFLYRSPETMISYTRHRYLIPVQLECTLDFNF